VTGIVEESEVGRVTVEQDLGHGGVVRLDPKQAIQVETQDMAQVDLDHAAVRHDKKVPIDVRSAEALDGLHRSLLEGTYLLSPRWRRDVNGTVEPPIVQVAGRGPDLGDGFSFPFSEPYLPKAINGSGSEAGGLAEDGRRVQGATERAGVEGSERSALQPRGEERGLSLASIAQAGVEIPLDPALLIPDRFSVADEQHVCSLG
jgi:hypothetical protein